MAEGTPSLIGRYKVVRHIGRGGMGVVYVALDPFIEREVAVKLLRSIDDEEAHERFMREIRIAGALSHPNIVRIYDAGTHEEQPFVAMEFVEGETVADLIKRGATLDLDRKLELMIDLSEGLGHAHKRGVVHRDIKPSNLIIDEHGRLKILDFGIARLANAGRTSVAAVGTPSYMAPEQIMGEVVDARADLFAFGVVIYEVVSYRRPFVGSSYHALYNAILSSEPEPLAQVAPGTPASLDTLLKTALAKSPADRFQTAQAIGDALRAIRSALTAEETQVVARRPRWEPPPQVPPPESGSGAPHSPKSGVSKHLAELRERQRHAAKDEARRALAEGRLGDALEAAERALVLDENDAGAHELAELARQSMDRLEAGRLLAEAEQSLSRGALAEAQQVIDRLRKVRSGTPEFIALEARLVQLRRDKERARKRDGLVEDARLRFEQRDLEGALAAVVEALELDPAHAAAQSLKASAEGALRARQAEREWHARARQAARQARALFESRQYEQAMRLLQDFEPPHPETTSLLADLQTRHAQIVDEQRRRESGQQRQKIRADGIARVTVLLDERRADTALEMLVALRTQGFVDDEIVALERRGYDMRLALANERRRATVLASGLEAARAALARQDPGAALLALEQLTADGFASPDIEGLAAEAHAARAAQQHAARERQEQLERERRSARLAAGLQQVQQALAREDAEGASVALRFLRREGFESAEVERLERDTTEMLAELERRRQTEVERERRAARLAQGVEQARAKVASQELDAALAAINLLRREGLDTPEVAALEAEARQLQQSLARERREQLERERRQLRLTQGLEEARHALDGRDPDAAVAALGLLRRDGFDEPEFAVLEADAEALRQQITREHREQLARERREARLGKGLADVRSALQGRDADAALAALRLLRRDGFDVAELAQLEAEAQALQQQLAQERQQQLERERREARLTKMMADGRAALGVRDPEAALAVLRLIRREGLDGPGVAELEAEAQALQQQIAYERREQVERERRQARLSKTLPDVHAALRARDPEAALAALGLLRRDGIDAPELDALEAEAQALQQQIARERQAQLERERRQAHLDESLQVIRSAVERRDPGAALAAVALLRREGFDLPEVAALEQEATQLRQQAARERREQLERERQQARLARGVEDARAALDTRDPDAALTALALLRRDGLGEAPELAALEVEATALQQQVAQERYERLERERREARLTSAAADVRAALGRRDADAAAAALGLLRAEGFDAEAASLAPGVEALEQELARERRERIEREGRGSRLARDAAEIRAALERRDPDAALAVLNTLEQDGLSLPDQRKLTKQARKLRDVLLREQTEAATRLAKDAQATAEAQQEATAGGRARPRWLAPAAAAAVLLIGGAIVAWIVVSRRPADTQTTASTTTAPAAEVAGPAGPSSVPASGASTSGTGPAASSDTPAGTESPGIDASALDRAGSLEKRGDLRGAARVLAEYAGKAAQPDAATANARLRTLASDARRRAERARQRAVAANTTATGAFAEGDRLFAQAAREVAGGPLLLGVTGFLDAEASFERAAGLKVASAAPTTSAVPGTGSSTGPGPASASSVPIGQPSQPPPVQVPAQPAVTASVPGPPPSGTSPGPGSAAPPPATVTPAAPATPAVPTPDTSAEHRLIDATVRRYFAARSQLDLAAVQAVYPDVPAQRERDHFRLVEGSCSEFAEQPLGVDVLRLSGASATVQAHVQTTCRPRAGKAVPPRTVDIMVTLEKAGGGYRITQVNRPDQAR